MGKKLKIAVADSASPFGNLALENTLLSHIGADEIIMFLWQNEPSVVIGRNQDCRSECRLDLLRSEGVNLVRRFSGGGAVYHDMGNLNFSLIAAEPNYDLKKNFDTVLGALELLGVEATTEGRNDIIAGGGKISGSAWHVEGQNTCHHGTVLVCCDIGAMSKFLRTDTEKYRTKGIRSIASRVRNLVDIVPSVTIDDVKSALLRSFQTAYDGAATERDMHDLPKDEIAKTESLLRSDEWIFLKRGL